MNRGRIDHIIESVEHDGALGIAPSDDDGQARPDFDTRILAGSNGGAS